jgi:hypothetical protein
MLKCIEMNIYIGYKYRNFKDKAKLKELLIKVSKSLTLLGHKTFILGRDEFRWEHHAPTTKSVTPIIKNLRKNGALLAVIECENKSNGLLFECIFAKLLRKKIVLAVKEGVSPKPFNRFTKKIMRFDDHKDLIKKIQNDFDKFLL